MAEFIVVCSAASGYRRAGAVLSQGENLLDAEQFTEEQLAQLHADPRLTVAFPDTSDSGTETQGAVEADRLAELVKHIQGLDKANASLWKQDGAPKASAYPDGTTAEERDAAWDAFTETLDGAE